MSDLLLAVVVSLVGVALAVAGTTSIINSVQPVMSGGMATLGLLILVIGLHLITTEVSQS